MRLSAFMPPVVRVAARTLRNDASMLRGSLTRGALPPFSSRHTAEELVRLRERAVDELRRRAEERERQDPLRREVEVTEVTRQTDAAVSLTLRAVDGRPWAALPGQFVTIEVEVGGERLRRCYSICESPGPTEIRVGVKQVRGGRVSGHLVSETRVGQRLIVTGPSGRFVPTAEEMAGHIVLVAGGSGITPLLAIARSVLGGHKGRVTLVYGNRSAAETMFASDIALLARRHVRRFAAVHVREVAGGRGRAMAGRVEGANLDAALPVDPAATYFVCGPAPMMDGVEAWLASRGIASERMRFERFSVAPADARGAEGLTHAVRFLRSGVLLLVPDTQTLLQAGLAAGLPLASSCTMGGCGACRVRLVSGRVDQPEPNCLTDRERAEGACLACIATPRGPVEIDA